MSGRVRVTLSDGRRVVGFRKTLQRRGPRSYCAHELPDWRLSFLLPDGMALEPGAITDIVGLTVGPRGWIEVAGKNKAWVIGQAQRLLRQICPHWRGLFLARLIRSNEPGPALSGPLRRGDCSVIEIHVKHDGATVSDANTMRQLPLTLNG